LDTRILLLTKKPAGGQVGAAEWNDIFTSPRERYQISVSAMADVSTTG